MRSILESDSNYDGRDFCGEVDSSSCPRLRAAWWYPGFLALVIASGCSSPSKADAPKPVVAQPLQAPRNFVCERMKLLDVAATCAPEYTDAGDGSVHTARITQKDKSPVACGLTAGQLGMVCGPLVAQPPQPVAPAADTKKSPKK